VKAPRKKRSAKVLALTRPEVTDVLRAYHLGRLLFLRPAAGTASPAVIAVTDRGSFFVKRRNPRYCSPGQLSYDHSLLRHLSRAGLPVYPALRTLSGSRWLERGGAVYEVFPLASGRPPAPGNPAQVEAAGRLLATLHALGPSLKLPGGKILPRLHDPQNILRGLHWAANQALSAPQRQDLERCIAVAEGIARNLPDDAYWALPQTVIHGDYHPLNLLYEGDQVTGLFDFDWSGPGPRMVDVADGILFFCGTRTAPLQAGDIVALTQPFTLDRGLIAAFGRGYATQVRPQPAELQALPELMRARWLFCRVDAMQRKVAPEHKLQYLLDGLTGPLEEIDAVEQWLASGEWLAEATGSGSEGTA
jgi:Ser/Thr protein kinase RdoA (MazF antagonist)